MNSGGVGLNFNGEQTGLMDGDTIIKKRMLKQAI